VATAFAAAKAAAQPSSAGLGGGFAPGCGDRPIGDQNCFSSRLM
jgi:hypothetical protein